MAEPLCHAFAPIALLFDSELYSGWELRSSTTTNSIFLYVCFLTLSIALFRSPKRLWDGMMTETRGFGCKDKHKNKINCAYNADVHTCSWRRASNVRAAYTIKEGLACSIFTGPVGKLRSGRFWSGHSSHERWHRSLNIALSQSSMPCLVSFAHQVAGPVLESLAALRVSTHLVGCGVGCLVGTIVGFRVGGSVG